MDTYTSLKEQYYKLIAEALNEPNAEKQQDIIKQILDTNTLLATEIRTYVSEQTQKPNNPEELQELTNELLNIQKEFLKIQETKDYKTTLEMILDNNQSKLFNLKTKLNIFLVLLGLSIIYILYMIFRLSMPTLPTIQTPQSLLPLK
jgi:hypothetical protein